MFKRICLKVNAENPQLPLMPSELFEGSAATFEISGVPRAFARRRITGVTVNVTNVDGQTAAVACVFEGGVWSCTVPSAAIGASGFVGNGVIIAASGTDETGAAVPCWILGAGDLKVRRQDGTIVPGATLQTLHWFDERPESPKAGDVAPSPDDQDVLELFDGETWRSFGGGAIEFDEEPTEGSQNAARSGGIWSWVKRLLTGKLDKSGGTLTGGLTFKGQQFGIQFNSAYQSIKFSNGIEFSQRGILIDGKPVYYPSASGTLALTSDIPAAVAVIDHADATTTGKAADALKVKEALDEKRGITDRKNYPETVQVLAERLPVVDMGSTFSNIRVVTDGPFRHEVSKYKVCGDVPEYQDIVICELDSFGKYVDGSGSATFGGVAPTAGMQIACGGETGVSDGDTLSLASDIDALAVKVVPRYPFVDAAIVDGKVTIAPYTNEKLTSDGTAFTVAVGGESIYMRDCVLRVECGDPAPKITWPSNYYPRTDAETDFACVAGKRNVYWITEHAPDEFCVAGGQETTGGNAQ